MWVSREEELTSVLNTTVRLASDAFTAETYSGESEHLMPKSFPVVHSDYYGTRIQSEKWVPKSWKPTIKLPSSY